MLNPMTTPFEINLTKTDIDELCRIAIEKTQNSPEQAEQNLQKALTLSQSINDPQSLSKVYQLLGNVSIVQGKCEKAIGYFLEKLNNAKKINDYLGITIALNAMGAAYIKTKKYNEAILSCEQALQILTEKIQHNSPEKYAVQGYIYTNLGIANRNIGKKMEAINFFENALQASLHVPDPHLLVSIYNNLGHTYTYVGDYEKAFEQLQKGISLAQQKKDFYSQLTFLNNLGSMWLVLNEHQKALDCFLEATQINDKYIKDKGFDLLLHKSFSDLSVREGKYDEALNSITKALKIAKEQNDKSNIALCLSGIAEIYKYQKKYNDALDYLNQSLVLKKEIQELLHISSILIQTAEIYAAQNQYPQALTYYQDAYQQALTNQFVDNQAKAIVGIAQIRLIQNNPNEAIQILQKLQQDTAIQLNNSTDINTKVLELLIQGHKNLNDFENAFNLQQQLLVLKEKIFEKNKNNAYIANKIKFEVDKKNQQLANQKIVIEQEREIRQELEVLTNQLQQKNRELQIFASTASHDMKEPLRMIISFSEIMQRSLPPQDPNQEALTQIHYSGMRLFNLLEDLIKYARADNNAHITNTINLNQIIETVKNNLFINIEETAATFEIETLPPVQASHTHLIQLFQNLIANALKFKQPLVPPHIKIYAIPNPPYKNMHLIAVQDNGLGIQPQYFTRIFKPFERLHAHSQFEGSGIGLATCKKIVDAYNGKIWVENNPNNQPGSTFYFYLPQSTTNLNLT